MAFSTQMTTISLVLLPKPVSRHVFCELTPACAVAVASTVFRRTGGQRQFSAALKRQMQSKSHEFDPLVTQIIANLRSDLSVSRLAAMANMSERTFARRFIATMGVSPARFVEDLRVDAACEAIQRKEARLSELPDLFGFRNAEQMRRAFQRVMGVAPSDYLSRFGK
jgi:transcriptional regulator GlxA family with amidase domain